MLQIVVLEDSESSDQQSQVADLKSTWILSGRTDAGEALMLLY